MLRFAIVFFVLALIAAFFGFGGVAGAAAGFAKLLLGLFVVLFLVTLVANFVSGSSSRLP